MKLVWFNAIFIYPLEHGSSQVTAESYTGTHSTFSHSLDTTPAPMPRESDGGLSGREGALRGTWVEHQDWPRHAWQLEEERKLCQLHRVQDSVLYHIINQSSSQFEKWPLARNPTQLSLQKSLHKMTLWALHPARLVPGDSFICFTSSVRPPLCVTPAVMEGPILKSF